MNANTFAESFESLAWRCQQQRPDDLLEALGYHREECELLELQSRNSEVHS